jgi:hypothetical protein
MHGFFLSQPSPDKIGERMNGYVSWLEVDLDNIGHNLDEIRRHTKVEVMPCVKNNAYGRARAALSLNRARQPHRPIKRTTKTYRFSKEQLK